MVLWEGMRCRVEQIVFISLAKSSVINNTYCILIDVPSPQKLSPQLHFHPKRGNHELLLIALLVRVVRRTSDALSSSSTNLRHLHEHVYASRKLLSGISSHQRKLCATISTFLPNLTWNFKIVRCSISVFRHNSFCAVTRNVITQPFHKLETF